MAHELTPWKKPGCAIVVATAILSTREESSSEINAALGEGGGLNASYRTVEAAMKASNILGERGLSYGTHFVFKTVGPDDIILDFSDEEIRTEAVAIFAGMTTIKPIASA